MADTARSLSDLQTLLADNGAGAISAQDLRDFLVSSLGVYGSLSVFDGSTSQGSLGGTPVKLTCFDTDGNSNGTTPAHASDQITINVSGNYDIDFNCAFSGTVSTEVTLRLRVDDVEQSFGVTRKLGTGGDIGSCSFKAPALTLTATDVVTVYVETDGAGSDQITVKDATLSVKMVG